MSEIREIVDQIRLQVKAGPPDLNDSLRELAESYAEAVSDANRRLKECDDRLSRGLRSDAIHIAEADPPLLDTIAALEFEELEEWEELSEAYGFPAIERLLTDVAAALEDEYLVSQSLETLMRRHRQYAIARVPLDRRIRVLRELLEKDGQPHWREDLEAWEARRVTDIERLAKDAFAQKDSGALQGLLRELDGTPWSVEVPEKLASRVAKAAATLQRDEARNAAALLAGQLAEAAEADNLVEAQALRAKYLSAEEAAKFPDGHSVPASVSEALLWLDGIDRETRDREQYEYAVAGLEEAIEDGASIEELEQQAAHLTSRGLDAPVELANRFQTAIATQQRDRSRKRVIIVALIVLLLTGVSATAVGVYRNHQYQTRLAKFVADTDQLIDEERLDEAQALADAHRDLSLEEDFEAVASRLANAIADRESRRDELAALVVTFSEIPKQKQLQESYAAAVKLADPAFSALHGEQIQKIEAAYRTAASRLDELRKRQLAEFDSAFEDLRSTVAELERSESLNDESFSSRHQSFLKRVRSLLDLAKELDASESALRTGQLGALQTRVDKMSDMRSSAAAWREATSGLASAAAIADSERLVDEKSFNVFVGNLKDFGETFSEELADRSITLPQDEVELWRIVLNWQKTSSGWLSNSPRTAETATERVSAVQSLLETEGGVPGQEALGLLQKYLFSVSVRSGIYSPIESLRTYLRDDRIRNVDKYETDDGRSFYSLKRSSPFSRLDPTFEHFRTMEIGRGMEQARPDLDARMAFKSVRSAPQNELAEAMLTMLDSFGSTNESDWLATFEKTAKLCTEATRVDPVLRLTVLWHTLEEAGRGHEVLRVELEPTLAMLENSGWDDTKNWLDPGYEPGQDKTRDDREDAVRLERKIPRIDSLFRRARASTDELHSQCLRPFFPVGIAMPTYSGRVKVHLGQSLPATHELLAIDVGEDSPPRWVSLGTAGEVDGSRPAEVQAALKPGRLIFATPADSSSNDDESKGGLP